MIFCGYPGAASFTKNASTWKRYITDSLIETVLARDVLQMSKIAKPVLLRHLFALAATLPAQFVSYTKMLGQLHLSYARYALEGLPNKVLFFLDIPPHCV